MKTDGKGEVGLSFANLVFVVRPNIFCLSSASEEYMCLRLCGKWGMRSGAYAVSDILLNFARC